LLYWLRWLLVFETSSLTAKSQSSKCSSTNCKSKNIVQWDIGVVRASLPITRIHPRVA
jgi:hypothetical protein